MNNLKVKYIDVPENIQKDISDEFCMGWEVSTDEDAVEVQFIDTDNLDGFRLNVGGTILYFDYFSTCYVIC